MKKIIPILVAFFIITGSIWIAYSSLIYFNSKEIAPFVLEKLPLSSPYFFLFILRSHVISALFGLTACLILSSSFILKKYQRLHRLLGRMNAFILIFILCPSGFYLSFFSRGGLVGTLGFMLSGLIVTFCMLKAIQSAKNKKMNEHKRYALHVFGQLSVAVISRVLLLLLEPYSTHPDLLYNLCLWIPVLGIFTLTEFISSQQFSLLSKETIMNKKIVFLLLLLISNSAYADALPSYNEGEIKKIIDKQFLEELKKKDLNISKFSRVPSPPQERRMRIVDPQFKKDGAGEFYVRFALDERYYNSDPKNPEAAWIKDKYQACLYLPSKEIWFQSYDKKFYPSSLLLGNFEASQKASELKCREK